MSSASNPVAKSRVDRANRLGRTIRGRQPGHTSANVTLLLATRRRLADLAIALTRS